MTQHGDDWIVPTSPAGTTTPAAAPVDDLAAAEPSRPARLGWRTGAAIVAAGVVLGVGGVLIAHQSSGGSSTAAAIGPAAGGAQLPGANGQFVPDGGGFGGRDGEQHVAGTITKVGTASITVRTSSGSTTYPIAPTTQIVRNGSAARLSDLKVGDPVEMHVIPSTTGGAATVERVLAGTRPAFGPGGGRDGDGRPGDGGGPDDGGPGA
ncbi:MAG: hypothetical protein ACTHMS_17390 [Jatrophihabitans sp.]|uniref:hypothetical protein n=1 Tax=Jatrophihabitans sp. TaxID=1932789 RepID=UPI003F7EF318